MPTSDQRRSGSGLPKFYAIQTVAEALEVSSRTVRRWIARGELIVHRVNGHPDRGSRSSRIPGAAPRKLALVSAVVTYCQ
jgi:excisionase family DNA binding protein